MLFLPKAHRERNSLDHPVASAVTSQRRVIKLMFKLLKHRCVFHITGAALRRLIAHCVSVPLPCPREQDALHSPWLLAGWVPWVPVLGGAARAGDSLAGLASAGDRVGTGVVGKRATAARLFCWHVHTGWATAEDLHTQSTLNLVLFLHYSFVWTADSLSLCSGGYFKS